MPISVILFFLGLPALVSTSPVSYAGYSVLEILPETEDDLRWIQSSSCQILNERVGVMRQVQVLCSRSIAKKFKKAAKKKNLSVKYIAKHFGEEVDMQERMMQKVGKRLNRKRRMSRKYRNGRKYRKKGKGRRKRHETFLDVKLMYEFYESLGSKYDIVKIDTIGETLEGRDIKIVKINSENAELPVIFIDAGVHAREWISPAAVMFFLDKMVRMLMKGKGEGNFASFQWHIIPLGNPDGYQFSIDKDRMWRKNRQANEGSDCEGVDINRNFPKAYGIASSKNPCDEDYRGTDAFSEKESATMRDYLEQIKDKRIMAAISVHSYGNVWIFPWGYTEEQHPEKARISKLAYKVVNTIRFMTGEIFVPGTAYEVFGQWGFAGGCTDDWYISLGIPYSFTIELPERDADGFHGFLLPPDNIKRVGKDLYIGFKRMSALLFKEVKKSKL